MDRILLIGGDRRQDLLAEELRRDGYRPVCFGTPASCDERELRTWRKGEFAAVILPLPVTRDGVHIHMPFAERSLSFEGLLARMHAGDTVFGGNISPAVKSLFECRNVRCIDYYDEDVILQNAEWTAFGTLCELEKYKKDAFSTLRYAVTGYGRVAKAVLHALAAKNADVTVVARDPDALYSAERLGFSTCALAQFQKAPEGFDVILNTVPAQILSRAVLEKTKPDVFLLELASPPFGIDLAAAEATHRTAVKALSLPGKYAPREAAKIVGDKIKSLLRM